MIAFVFTCFSFLMFVLAVTSSYVCFGDSTDVCWPLGDDYFEWLDTKNGNSTWSTVYTLHVVIIVAMAVVWIYYPLGRMLGYYDKSYFKIVEFSLQTLSFLLGIVALVTAVGGYEDTLYTWGFGYYATILGILCILPAHLLWIYYYFYVRE